ncbi:MAG: NUDIX hydrolase [Gammaproteobacteria bacterium]
MSKIILYQGDYLQICSIDTWEFVERPNCTGIVNIIAVTDNEELLLIEQYRAGLDNVVIELPAGLAGDHAEFKNESLEKAAKRELLEETGYEAQRLKQLISTPPSCGMSSEIITFFYSDKIKKIGCGGGIDSEDICVYPVPIKEIASFLADQQRQNKAIATQVYAGLYLLSLERNTSI